ncbi:MAG: hypothetical protein WEA10_00805 [Actinomycetota bacterium]
MRAFEHGMEMLAQADGAAPRGRYIVTPQKGVAFLGPQQRAKARAKDRRRRVFVFLLESIGLTFLIGLVPPLRSMWMVSGVLTASLALYVWMLLAMKAKESMPHPHEQAKMARPPADATVQAGAAMSPRFSAEGASRTPRPAYNGLNAVDEGDAVHVVVLPDSESLSAARA